MYARFQCRKTAATLLAMDAIRLLWQSMGETSVKNTMPTPIMDAFVSCIEATFRGAALPDAQYADLQRFFFAGAKTVLGIAHAPEISDPRMMRAILEDRIEQLTSANAEVEWVKAVLEVDPLAWPRARKSQGQTN
jgi:hypothetical protein